MSQTYTVTLADGREVCFSYGVPVAAFLPGRGYVRTRERYSLTTSKHMNGYAGRDAIALPEDEFLAAIAPVVRGSR